MKTIPEIRKRLLTLANTRLMSIDTQREIKALVKAMYRRPPVRRAPAEHVPLTPQLIAKIKRTALNNPKLSYAKLGRLYTVSIGRISEVLAGKRAA